MAERKDGQPRQKPQRKMIHVFEVLDDNGKPLKITKANIKTILATSNTDMALDMLEAGDHPNAVFVRAPLA